MARLMTGSINTEIAGKIGGTVFQRGASGTIIKNRGYRTKSNSPSAGQNRVFISLVNGAWCSSDIENKLMWQDYSVFKQVPQKNNPGRFLNGHQIYLLYNYARFSVLGTIESLPIFDVPAPFFNPIYIRNDGGTLSIQSDGDISELENMLLFKISAPVKPGRKSAPGGTKFIKAIFASTSVCNITSAYTALYGFIPAVGSYVQIEYQYFYTNYTSWSVRVKQIQQITASS